MTRRHSSDIRAFLLGLIQKANVGNLRNVHPIGKRMIHPLLYMDHTRVLSCLSSLKRSCIASDAGLRSRFIHGGLHLGIVPVLRAVGPSIDSAVTRATHELTSITRICRRTVRMTEGQIVPSKRAVSVPTLYERSNTRGLLFRLLCPLNFGTTRMDSIFHTLRKRSKQVFRDHR